MRQWRKLYEGIRSSNRIDGLDYEARWLYILLLSAQDDAGRYPWVKSRIKGLVAATTDWDASRVRAACDSLAHAGLITVENDMVQIIGGAEKNGTPSNARGKAMLYDIPVCDSHATRSEAHASPTRARVEKSREEKSRGEAAPGASAPAWLDRLNRHPGVTAAADQEWIDQIETDFSDVDLEFQTTKFLTWWEESPKTLKRWKTAWLNWLERVPKGETDGRIAVGTGANQTGSPGGGPGNKFAGWKPPG